MLGGVPRTPAPAEGRGRYGQLPRLQRGQGSWPRHRCRSTRVGCAGHTAEASGDAHVTYTHPVPSAGLPTQSGLPPAPHWLSFWLQQRAEGRHRVSTAGAAPPSCKHEHFTPVFQQTWRGLNLREEVTRLLTALWQVRGDALVLISALLLCCDYLYFLDEEPYTSRSPRCRPRSPSSPC